MNNYENLAVILVGYQNDYFAKNGVLRGVVEEPGRVDEVLENSINLIRQLADTKALIISTPIVLESTYRALSNSSGILDKIKESGAFSIGTFGAENIPELEEFGDRVTYVSGKVGFNAFSKTDLENTLTENGIKEVWVCGMVTSLCIDSTGRAAYERGYKVSIVEDCSSARTALEHDFYCQNVFPLYGSVIESKSLEKI
jgi:nicotinamidase-related amidase